MQDRDFPVRRMTFGEIAIEACTVVGGVLMTLGALLFMLVSILGFDGFGWVLVGIPLLVSTALIVVSISTGYLTGRELAEPEDRLVRIGEMDATESDKIQPGRNLRQVADDVEGGAREPPSRRGRGGGGWSRSGSQHAIGAH